MTKKSDETERALITYKLGDDDNIIVDIALNDFDKESIEALAQICAKISSEQLAYETVKHIRDLLSSNDQMGLLVPFVAKLNEQTALLTKLFNNKEQNKNDDSQPCISPSDMM